MALPPSSRVVITGAGSGLGKALALALAERGARLLVSDLRPAAAEATALEARARGAREVEPTGCDVTKVGEVEALAARALELWGGLDLLINNAGVGAGGEVGETSLDTWRFAIDVNLWGVIHGCHVFVPILKRQGHGHVLNVASIAGLIYAPHMAPYNVTKAGVVALSETLRVEVASRGIGVTVLCPTFFETGIADNMPGVGERYVRFARSQMKKAQLTARDVALAALEAVDLNTLHAVPMPQGRWMWRARRLSPELFIRALTRIRRRVESKEQP